MVSPHQGCLVTPVIKINGSAISEIFGVTSIRIEQSINQISSATIVLKDGSPASEDFPISESSIFLPGNDVAIELGYDGESELVFQGIVSKQGLKIADGQNSFLEVLCSDKAVQMNLGRKNRHWNNITDSAAISSLIANAGLLSSVSSTAISLPELVQYYATDWDFLLRRAGVNGLVVSTINNQVNVFDPISNTDSVLTLTYGQNMISLNAEINALAQLPKVTASAWDYQHQQLISAEANNEFNGPGNISSTELASVGNLSTYELQTTAAESIEGLSVWAKSKMLRNTLSKITGTVVFRGDANLVPGKYLTLAGLGARFNGDHFVSAVRHEIADGDWLTEVDFGLTSEDLSENSQIEAPAASGLLPGIGGLFNAVVKQIDNDPENEYRVLIEVGLFTNDTTGIWARLSNFYSSSGTGAFFLPEIGDEVIVGFLNQDPRFPVILGSLYSQRNKPASPFTPNEKNNIKGIVTKSGVSVLFDDEQRNISIKTPGNNTIELRDQDKQVSIEDESGNSIVMSPAGIAIKSNRGISLEAAQQVTIKGNTGIHIESIGGDVSTKGVNINETAEVQFSANGNVEANIEGGATLVLKAAMVMIN